VKVTRKAVKQSHAAVELTEYISYLSTCLTFLPLSVQCFLQGGPKNETTLVRPTAATVQDKIKRISPNVPRVYENND